MCVYAQEEDTETEAETEKEEEVEEKEISGLYCIYFLTTVYQSRLGIVGKHCFII